MKTVPLMKMPTCSVCKREYEHYWDSCPYCSVERFIKTEFENLKKKKR
jgi:RNA polymerase subunit RPABC4/transcription elongation factor Spt4